MPDNDKLDRLASELDISKAWLYTGEGSMERANRQLCTGGGQQTDYGADGEVDLQEIARHVDYCVRDASGRIRFRVTYLVEAGPTEDITRNGDDA